LLFGNSRNLNIEQSKTRGQDFIPNLNKHVANPVNKPQAPMDAAVVNNPDGSAAVVVPENPRTRPARVYPPVETQSNPSPKIQTNPFPEHDRVAMGNLQMMQKQDAAAWAEHEAADSVS